MSLSSIASPASRMKFMKSQRTWVIPKGHAHRVCFLTAPLVIFLFVNQRFFTFTEETDEHSSHTPARGVSSSFSSYEHLDDEQYAYVDAIEGPKHSIYIPNEFSIPAAALPHKKAPSTGTITLAADVFLVDGCIKFVSVITCQRPDLNFSVMKIEVRAIYDGYTCFEGGACNALQGDDFPMSLLGVQHPLTRVLHRDGWSWEPVTIGELCLAGLEDVTQANVTLW